MQCFEYEMVRATLATRLAGLGLAHVVDELDLADVLDDHDVSSVEQIADIVSIARNLQAGVHLAA